MSSAGGRLQAVRDCYRAYETGERRLVEAGDEVFVTYEATRTDGRRFRNTEIFGFDGAKVRSVEVYFGWDLPSR